MPISFNITNRFSGAVIFTAEIEATEETPLRIKLGLAVRKAVTARANLADANLARANLADANLADAYLAGANLADANLADANLARANLADANLARANLADAYLARAKWKEGVTINKVPLYVSGLRWRVTILDDHMQIGCQFHSLERWAGFSDGCIAKMDGNALEFWKGHKDLLLGLAKANGRGV